MPSYVYYLKGEDTLLRRPEPADGSLEVWEIRAKKWGVYGSRDVNPNDLRRVDEGEANEYIAQGAAAKGPRQPSLDALERVGRRGSRSTSRSRSE